MANVENSEQNDLHNGMVDGGNETGSASLPESAHTDDPDTCGICKGKLLVPRVLSCLHVFCEQCLSSNLNWESGDAENPETAITCPTCSQETKMGADKVSGLPLGVMLTNLLDSPSILSPTSTCCSIAEVAMSRCATCSTYLCSSCNAAHKNMRCFKNHQVVMLNELGSGDQPTLVASTQLCLTHYSEPIDLYCFDCEELVCNNCAMGDHRPPTHNCVALADAETRVKQDLHALIRDGNANIELLLQASTDMQKRLSELAKQQFSTRDMINGSYEECEAVLERCRNKALAQLNEFYHEHERNLLKMTHELNEEVRLVQNACKFTTRLLKRGSCIDSLSLAKVVRKQILNLINNSAKPRSICSGIIELVTDLKKFEVAAMSAFGLGISNECTLSLQNPITNRIKPLTETKSPILSIPKDIDPEHLHPVSTEQKQSVSTIIVQPMQILFKFGKLGSSARQFSSPHGFCLGFEEDIVVADTNNHRIQVFEKNGTFKYQFGNAGPDEGKLWYPRKVAVMKLSGKYVVCDCGNERSRMQIFARNGHFIKKIAIRYIEIVAAIAVTKENEIVAVDSVSPTVFVISEEGELLRWFDCTAFMSEPSDICIHDTCYYLSDFKGHKVVKLNDKGEFVSSISYETVTKFPSGIEISGDGDILVCDSHGNHFHIAIFDKESSLVAEFECTDLKISRCCGLKITSEGYIVTLAKNNNHVLVLNKLYIC